MPHVFLSYSRKDQTFVRRLHDALLSRQRETWVDWEGIPLTAEWLAEVFQAIDAADAFVFVISPDSVVSPVCLKEVEHAVANSKRLIPVLHRDVDSEPVPTALSSLNYLFARADDDLVTVVTRLVETIDTDLDWVRAHSRVLRRAQEWEARDRDSSFLLRGMDLQDAVRWLAEAALRKHPQPTSLHHAYIEASRVHDAAEVQRLQDLYTTALARQLAAQAELMRQQRAALLPRSILLAVEALRRRPSSEAYLALLSGLLLLPKPQAVLTGGHGLLAHSPGNDYVATAPRNPDGAFEVWAPQSGVCVAHLEFGRPTSALGLSPDGRFVAAAGPPPYQAGQTALSPGHAVTVWAVDDSRQVCSVAHGPRIEAMAFSGDSRYLATGDVNGLASIWEVPSGASVARLLHDHSIDALAFSPNDRFLATGSSVSARVWELATQKEIVQVTHLAAVQVVAFSPDGRYLATASVDRTAAIWDLREGRELARVPPGAGQAAMAFEQGITGVAFSPDSSRLATAGWDRSARIWDVPSGRELLRVTHEDGVSGVVFTPDGRYLVTSSADHTARVWLSDTGRERLRVSHEEPVERLALASNGRLLITCGSARDAQVTDLDDSGVVVELRHKEFVDTVYFSPSGESVATTSWYEGAHVWDADRGRLRSAFVDTEQSTAIAFSPDGAVIATASKAGIALRDARTCPIVRRLDCPGSSRVCFSGDGRLIAVAANEHLHLWNVSTGEHSTAPHKQIFDVAFSIDGQYVATMGHDNMVRIWDTSTARQQCEIAYNITARCSWSGAAARLATAHSTTRFRVVVTDAATGVTLKEWPQDQNVSVVQFSPDGRWLAIAAGDAYLLNADDGQRKAHLPHDGDVTVLAFSPDGRFLASGSSDHTARVWLVEDGSEVARLPHPDKLLRVTFSGDGRRLATASWDRVVRIWRWRPEDLVAEACARIRRNFTPEEWRRHFGDEPYRQTCPQA